ncbi:MAG TPA: tetratricopeptide repeat protein [Gammaproteobacteria bacterium]|jgi:tetratricopeptide (TPR) repeat protein|nr:tetratricopeptide repeat protein [Gammaproteobacteria bacterium]HIK72808.1 tetratricopeptide repeat protein [Gammaproteobacteria bacterium]
MFNNSIKISLFCVLIALISGCLNTNTKQELIDRAGAPLLSGLGDHSHLITTSQDGVQEYFNQGLVLAFAFNHAESIRSFKAAQTLDPSCAMCYWGEALARGPNINVTSNGKAVMSDEERIKAFEVVLKAKDLMVNSTPKEQAYITALSSRYDGDITSDRNILDLTYAEAMEKVVRTYPEDMDAASLYSEALMNTMPWNYWSDDGSPKPDTIKVISKLEEVLEKEPNHPLAIHLYIHAVEASSSPERAELAAERLGGLTPGAGHLVHMPAHIFWRVGRYHDASEANINAAKVDEEYIAQCNAQGFYPAAYYPHNIHFLWAASTMEGRSELSIESALKVAKYVNLDQIKLFPTIEYFHTIPLLSYVRFGKWEEILNSSKPAPEFKYSQGIYHYAKGMAYAAGGELQKAREEQSQILPLKESKEVKVIIKGGQPSGLLLEIASELLTGQIAFSNNNYSIASRHFEAAVNLQDSLPYTEPPFWYYPARQSLGSSLMKEGKISAAENVYRRDLQDYPRNGWSLFGLSLALEAQGKTEEAEEVSKKFKLIWQLSDIELEASII